MTPIRLNPASPWVYDTRLLSRQAGVMKRFQETLTSDDRMGIDVLAVPAGEPIRVNLRLESVVEGVLVSGTAISRAEGECARCLTAIDRPVGADLRELFAYPNSLTAQTNEDEEVLVLTDDLIDLEALVRDEIVIQMPLAPLCRSDCPGLCATCGERLDDLEPGHTHEILDPRWAALRNQFGHQSSRPE
ncbi:MAG: YceD family protein [Nakamurella sp.]